MKKRLLILAAVGLAGTVVVTQLQGDVFDSIGDFFSKDIPNFFKGVGSDIQKAYNESSQWVKNRADDLGKAFDKVGECAQVVPLGIEWTSKKAAYAVAKATLDAAKTLQELDPELTGYRTALGSLIAARETALAALNTGKYGAIAIGKVGEGFELLTNNVLDIQKLSFRGGLAELKMGKIATFSIQAKIAGKTIKLNNIKIDMNDIKGMGLSLAKSIASAI